MSTMTSALSNLFSLERHRARFRSDRIDNRHHDEEAEEEDDDDRDQRRPVPSSSADPQATPRRTTTSVRNRSFRRSGASEGTAGQRPSSTPVAPSAAATRTSLTVPRGAAPDDRRDDSSPSSPASPNSATAGNPRGADDDDELDVASPGELSRSNDTADDGSPESAGRIPILAAARNTLTLAELEEERELARRRSSLCILLASFVLFRLWVSAIQEGDFGLMLLCLMGTSWTARWISYNREREEELDRRIAHYLEHGTAENGGTDPTLERSELRMLSFQAQLALAIMESQRQMMQGGYGHPDGGDQQPGVSEEARAKWTHFRYQASEADTAPPGNNNKAGYGSVTQKDNKDSALDGDGPHCSICLSEYEDGDGVVKLPCNHLYHDECISSWTVNHVKCPLCNYDLESAALGDSSPSEIV